jgi:formate/nitrite transporter FocA (FNT family)
VSEERQEEEKQQEPQKSYETILEQEVRSGLTELERSAKGLLLSGLSAGLDVSFSLLLIAVMTTRVEGRLPEWAVEILVANMYAVGFLFVVLGRSELFTEHTTLAVLPVLAGRSSAGRLLRLWGLVYVSNLAGVAAFTAATVLIGPALHIVDPPVFGRIASQVVAAAPWVLFGSAVLAGWLMGLLSWLVAAVRDTISQVAVVWLVTASIGFLHLHHSIVGSAEVLSGVFSGQGATFADFARFLALATLGNIVGGGVFVALIKYGHASQASS